MEITVRKADERGKANLGWLKSRHSFSFGHYYDPANMGFGPLRVINEDHIAPGGGFPTHPHSDMEIVTYVLSGALEHKDSLGTGSVIHPGDVQRMTAGTGIRHSEFNASGQEPVHLLQIWILPERAGLKPSYEQKFFSEEEKRGNALIASRDGRGGSVTIHQDASVFATQLENGEQVTHTLHQGRGIWVQVARGSIAANGLVLEAGDAIAIEGPGELQIAGKDSAEALIFDLPLDR